MKKIFYTFLFVSLLTSTAFANKINFLVSEQLSVDDNIYLTKNYKKSSVISSTQLYAKYLSPIPSTSMKFSGMANVGYNLYSENSSRNNYLNAGVDLGLIQRYFNVKENFLYTADPANSSLTDRAKRFRNIFGINYVSNREKTLGFGVSFADILDNYTDSDYDYLNRNRINISLKLFYNLSPRTAFYLAYMFSNINYSKNDKSNSTGNAGILGVDGYLSAKIQANIEVSYNNRSYDKKIDGVSSDGDLVGYLISFKYRPCTQTNLNLFGERKMEETVCGNNRYYESTSINLEAKQGLYQKWYAGLLVGYENMKYPIKIDDIDRNDNFFKVEPSIEYKRKENLSLVLSYLYRNKTTNYKDYEYSNNIFGLKVKYNF